MSKERQKVLQMIADGTVSVEDGDRLLSRLEPEAETNGVLVPTAIATEGPDGELPPLKYLRVVVDGSDKINVRVPISLLAMTRWRYHAGG